MDPVKPGDTLTLVCKFYKADVPNHNGRTYTTPVLEKALGALNARAKDRTVFGQLGNALDGKSYMSEASHIVEPTLRLEDGRITADVKIMDTVRGRDLCEMMEGGMKFTLAPRGIGSISPEGVVGADFELSSVDLVPDDETLPVTLEGGKVVGHAHVEVGPDGSKIVAASITDPAAQRFIADKMQPTGVGISSRGTKPDEIEPPKT